MEQNAFVQSVSKSAPRLAIYFAICIAAASTVFGQEAKLLNVQPAIIKDGEVRVYGVIRELPDYPLFDGTVLAIQITASDSDLTTKSRRDAQGAPCAICTTTHYFLVSEENERRPEVLYRMAPGPVTYIHINKKEYMLGRVELSWVDEKPLLQKVTLLQTGFAPPLFKRRINIRFDDPVEFVSEAEKVADMAMRDAFFHLRPTTLPKVFPPEDIPEVASGLE
ncbi:MAG: hypothetical protein OXG25_11035 [Gammaproteobacteria bacterium]|nr:hypothetical protein [Gammaproteobacteria bacterium]